MTASTAMGLGCMHLSTAPDRDDARAIDVIHAALDAGATLLDTADVYGDSERRVAEALRSWSGDRAGITVATKGGLVRTKRGPWLEDGRAKHLREACDRSRRALGVDTIDLYQLHAVDPKTPIETSVRALAALRKEGAIRAVGLCNVTVGQIEAARRIVEIASVQVSLSPFDDESLRNGVAEYCRDSGVRLIAYRPLGGDRAKRLSRIASLAAVAEKHGTTPATVALAWLAGFEADVVPIPGATRVETARAIADARALALALDDDDRRLIDAELSGRLLRLPRAQRRPTSAADGDVVVLMGMPGAGKSTLAAELEGSGYLRLNRDELGGTLSGLVARLDETLRGGERRVVLDNTYPTRAARNQVIECAWSHGVRARCIWLTTALGEAQVNAIRRMVAANEGRLPSPEEIQEKGKRDPRFLAPNALFSYERSLERPTIDEGFESVDSRHPERSEGSATGVASRSLATLGMTGVAVVDLETLLASPEEIRRLRTAGWLIFAYAWRPGGAPPPPIEGVEIGCCVHPAGPPVCWCRKPIPGLPVAFAMRHGIALADLTIVGEGAADRTMAERLGAAIVPTLENTVSSG